MDELKPCPFCGGEAVMHMAEDVAECVRRKAEIPEKARLIRITEYPDGHKAYEFRMPLFVPRCSNSWCVGRSQKRFMTEQEAIEAWNRRANDDG